MGAFVTFIKRYKKFLLPIIAVLLIAVIVAAIVSAVNTHRLKEALDLDSGSYDRVQIKITENMVFPEDETSSEESDIANEDSQDEIFTDENGYYDEYGSFISYSSETTNTGSQDEDDDGFEMVTVIKKDGDVFYQKVGENEAYYYKRDGQHYSLSRNDYGFGGGDWIEYKEDNIGNLLMFDINVFNSLDYKRLVKSGQEYVPQDKCLDDLFYVFMGIPEVNRSKYTAKSFSIKLDKNRVRAIKVSYNVENNGEIIEVDLKAKFSYNDTALKLPQAGSDTENN